MAVYNYSGYANYVASGDLFDVVVISGEISEDDMPAAPQVGTINNIFEVGEETLDNGMNFDETYQGTATVDGVDVIVLVNAVDTTFFMVPAGTDPNSITWPANLADITINPVSSPVCFASGTRIKSPTGETPVEDLTIGDFVLTCDGTARPVKWIGRQTVSTRFGPAERLMPVRFAAGSLGDGVPYSDLTVTADHAMLVGGVLCNAGALVNGTTITRVPLAKMGETFTVYHVETEDHEIILANGAPAETFIDTVSRKVFDNYTEFQALYGDVPDMEELPLPRAATTRQLPLHLSQKLGVTKAA